MRRLDARLVANGITDRRPLLNIALGVLCIAAIVVAYTSVGAASQSSAQSTRTATVQAGVVQSTVSGSGNIQAASQLNLGFKTSGTVTHIYVSEGEHVGKGELLATLDPQSAEVILERAKANLQSAEASLSAEEEDEGETSSGQGTTGTSTAAQAGTASISDTASSSPSTTTQKNETTTAKSGRSSSGGSSQKLQLVLVRLDGQRGHA